ncbi:mfs general substrate transporter [Malassezia pachydermatis]|uniref:Mfs general substrate transporter n=1 Tax=Malassezia pachydermatis TaxID=77020 RepID=A0A0M8MQL4_9BASI|nr:mfs general substrate transporter [Malassezia pachydermatis]KOS16358.1 mfs general substrate transporter [Malassezia pachydermatis]
MGEDGVAGRLHEGEDVPHMPHMSSQLPGADYVPVDMTEGEEAEHGTEEAMYEVDELAWLRTLPPWRRPRPLWLLPIVLFFSVATGIIIAPRMELMLSITCESMGVSTTPRSTGSLSLAKVPSTECRRSVPAQSQLAMLQLQMLVAAGIGSALTTGLWSRLSDRHGRKTILSLAISGAVINCGLTVLVAIVPVTSLPFGPQTLIFGSVIEGLFGSTGTVTAMAQSYLTDVTFAGTRSKLFALMTGSLFAGIAIGPTMGGILTSVTGSLVTSLLSALSIYALIIVVSPIIPESLRPDVRRQAVEEHEAAVQAAGPGFSGWRQRVSTALSTSFQSLYFLLPKRRTDYSLVESQSTQRMGDQAYQPGWDTNLFFLSIAYATETACIAVVPLKIQYVQLIFGWNSREVGYFLSYTAVTRMLTLTLVMPLLVKLLHHMPKSIVLPQDSAYLASENIHDLLDDRGCSRDAPLPSQWSAADVKLEKKWREREKQLRLIHDSQMDMRIALGSAALTAFAAIITAHATTTTVFLLGVVLTSLGGGIGSAISSLGMAVNPRTDGAGRLFGAWAVLSTLAGSIVGPFLFSLVFSYYVSTAPYLVFYVVALLQAIVILCLFNVHLRKYESLDGLAPRPSPVAHPLGSNGTDPL